jgi:replicative DNA helicase
VTSTLGPEAALLSSFLVEPGEIAQVAAVLSPDDFEGREYARVYEGMLELVRDGKRVDAVTLRAKGLEVGDLALVHPGRASLDYAEIIREGKFRRDVTRHLEDVRLLTDGGRPREDILQRLSLMSMSLSDGRGDGSMYDGARAVAAYGAIRRERALHGVGLPYGIASLDRWLQPAHGGDMVVIAARPSIGKTILAEHVADHWAFESDYPVMFVSIEMSLGQLMDRAVARWGGIPSSHIVRGVLTQDEEHQVEIALEARKLVNLWYVDNPYSTTHSIANAAAEITMQAGGIRGIIVDYLQLVKDKGDNDNQRIGHISRDLKALARKFDCPMLVLSQLNRQSEYRPDPHPRLSDIRDSGAVEQDADVVLGLYRDRQASDDGLLEIEILKNRQGPLAEVNVEFDGTHVRLNTEE